MNLTDIATVSGKGGLFKIVAPTKGGMILETLDDKKKKLVVNMHSKVSILGEISIYTTDRDGAQPLQEVLKTIHKEFDGDTGLSSSSDPDELKSFLKFVLPNYDEDRVYVSDIKKLVNWYNLLAALDPNIFLGELPKDEEVNDESQPKGES